MDSLEEIQKAVAKLLENAQNESSSELGSAVEKASAAIRLSADLEKSRAEVKKLELEQSKLRSDIDSSPRHERSENIREYVTLLSPIISVVTLAATLLVQGWQFSQSEKDKREATEDSQWEETVKTISQDNKLAPTVIALNPFLKSPRYGDLAKATAVQLLANGDDGALFRDLFGAAFVPVSWNNFDLVIRVNRALLTRELPLDNKSYDSAKDTNDDEKLTPEERKIKSYNLDALVAMCPQIAALLRSPRPESARPDLTGTELYNCDCKGIDLRDVDLEGSEFVWVDLKGAKLEDITQFDNSYFYHSAWWEAENMSPKLLKYLESDSSARYKEGAEYGPNHDRFTAAQYAAAIERLERGGP
jgi:hypothetical protein